MSAAITATLRRGGEKELLRVSVKEKGDEGRKKDRIIVITSPLKKTAAVKIKIHKLKAEKADNYVISKSFDLADVKSLESGKACIFIRVQFLKCLKKETTIMISLGKLYHWELDDNLKKIEFLFTIVDLSKRYSKRVPKLLNVDEELLRDQMELAGVKFNAADKVMQEDATDVPMESTGPDDADEMEAEMEQTDISRTDANLAPIASQNVHLDLSEVLNDFSWQAGGAAADLELRLFSELQALEAANVHAIIGSEEQANAVVAEIDLALTQLDVIDEWLGYYTQLLDSMGQDVHQVEIKNKAMQIASANQKNLLSELERVLSALKLPSFVTEALRNEPLDQTDGILQCERATGELMRVLATKFEDSLSELGMVSERMTLYNGYARQFSTRLYDHVYTFITNFNYIQELGRVYRKEMHDYLDILKQNSLGRKVTGDEPEVYIFLQQQTSVSTAATKAIGTIIMSDKKEGSSEKRKLKLEGWRSKLRRKADDSNQGLDEDEEDESPASHARTHSRTVSLNLGGGSSFDAGVEDRLAPEQVVAKLYSVFCHAIVREQNFLIDIFGLRSKDTEEEILKRSVTSDLWLEDLNRSRELESKDLKLQNRTQEICEGLFDGCRESIFSFIESSLKSDPTCVVGMMSAVEELKKEFETKSYSYINHHLDYAIKRLASLLDKFIDEQVRVIDETKVTIKKRTGILPFIRVFPKFVDRIESFISIGDGFTRNTVSKAYERLVRVIFEAVEAVAKDTTGEPSTKGIPTDDKEQLNASILTVDNMHFFYSELRSRKVDSLDPFVKAAKLMYDLNLNSYIKVVIRKPLGKLLEFFEGIEELLKTLAAEEVGFHLQFSKSAMRDVIRKYPGKEIKKGLDLLYKRVDKHYNEGLLTQVVWRGIQEEFVKQLKRYEEIISLCYPDSNVRVEFTVDDLLGYFSELAQTH